MPKKQGITANKTEYYEKSELAMQELAKAYPQWDAQAIIKRAESCEGRSGGRDWHNEKIAA